MAKSSQYVATVGAVDELNSHIGVVLAELSHDSHQTLLMEIQQNLFNMGAVLSLEGEFDAPDPGPLETTIAELNAVLPPLTEFVLPRGSRLVAAVHVCRTVTRRAEAEFWKLIDAAPTDSYIECARYLNRLSDFFFVLARFHTDTEEVQWRGPDSKA